MAMQSMGGEFFLPAVPAFTQVQATITDQATVVDAVNEAMIFWGQIVTSDGASHTIDTTGSSKLNWKEGTTTFASGSTSVSVGLAPVTLSSAPRANHTSNVINFDVKAVLTGGGGGISSGWMSHTPTTGTKTIANGDKVAFAVQMTARGGSDALQPQYILQLGGRQFAGVTNYAGGTYTAASGLPNFYITFSDGTFGWMHGTFYTKAVNTTTWGNTSGQKEYGTLFSYPFPYRVHGIAGICGSIANGMDVVLYTDPFGTPVAQRTANGFYTASAQNKFSCLFTSPYDVPANTPVVFAMKPTSSGSLITPYRTLDSADHRAMEPYGTNGYSVSRNTGAFSQLNSALDVYSVGPLMSGFNHPARPTMQIGL